MLILKPSPIDLTLFNILEENKMFKSMEMTLMIISTFIQKGNDT
jgi:hypothetical protein